MNLEPIRVVTGIIRSMPDATADALDGWVMRQHSSVDVGDEHPVIVCRSCRKHPAWPCEPHVAALSRIEARRRLRST